MASPENGLGEDAGELVEAGGGGHGGNVACIVRRVSPSLGIPAHLECTRLFHLRIHREV